MSSTTTTTTIGSVLPPLPPGVLLGVGVSPEVAKQQQHSKQVLSKYRQPHPVVRTHYPIPQEQSLVKSIMQNTLLCSLGGLQHECPELLYRTVPKETALQPSNCQRYMSECTALDAVVHLAVIDQLSITAGRKNLYSLNCSGIALGDIGIKTLLPLILNNPNITSLTFRLCNISDASVVALVGAIKKANLTRLRVLDFSCNTGIKDAGAMALLELISPPIPQPAAWSKRDIDATDGNSSDASSSRKSAVRALSLVNTRSGLSVVRVGLQKCSVGKQLERAVAVAANENRVRVAAAAAAAKGLSPDGTAGLRKGSPPRRRQQGALGIIERRKDVSPKRAEKDPSPREDTLLPSLHLSRPATTTTASTGRLTTISLDSTQETRPGSPLLPSTTPAKQQRTSPLSPHRAEIASPIHLEVDDSTNPLGRGGNAAVAAATGSSSPHSDFGGDQSVTSNSKPFASYSDYGGGSDGTSSARSGSVGSVGGIMNDSTSSQAVASATSVTFGDLLPVGSRGVRSNSNTVVFREENSVRRQTEGSEGELMLTSGVASSSGSSAIIVPHPPHSTPQPQAQHQTSIIVTTGSPDKVLKKSVKFGSSSSQPQRGSSTSSGEGGKTSPTSTSENLDESSPEIVAAAHREKLKGLEEFLLSPSKPHGNSPPNSARASFNARSSSFLGVSSTRKPSSFHPSASSSRQGSTFFFFDNRRRSSAKKTAADGTDPNAASIPLNVTGAPPSANFLQRRSSTIGADSPNRKQSMFCGGATTGGRKNTSPDRGLTASVSSARQGGRSHSKVAHQPPSSSPGSASLSASSRNNDLSSSERKKSSFAANSSSMLTSGPPELSAAHEPSVLIGTSPTQLSTSADPFAIDKVKFFDALDTFQRLMNRTTCCIDLQVFHDQQPHSYNLARSKITNRDPPVESINFVVYLEATFPRLTRARIIEAVEQYSEYAFVQHVAARTSVDRLRVDQKQEMFDMFQLLDKDKDGVLTKEELFGILSDAGRDAAELVMAKLDVDEITFETFISLTLPYLQEAKRRKRWR